jgi:hypothetical protein
VVVNDEEATVRSRYLYAAIGFVLGLGIALLVGAMMQARSGNTYQVYHDGMPGEIYTASWSRTGTGILVILLGGFGLYKGYRSGRKLDELDMPGQSLSRSQRWDLGLVILLAVLSSPLRRVLAPLVGVYVDLAQVALVAVAVAWGWGPALLAGGAGLVMGTALGSGAGWFLLIVSIFGGLEGAIAGLLASRANVVELLEAGVAAAILALVPFIVTGLTVVPGAGGPTMLLMLTRVLVSVALGMLVGLPARRAGAGKTRSA